MRPSCPSNLATFCRGAAGMEAALVSLHVCAARQRWPWSARGKRQALQPLPWLGHKCTARSTGKQCNAGRDSLQLENGLLQFRGKSSERQGAVSRTEGKRA